MQESKESINLMLLNCERINLLNSETYQLGVSKSSFKRYKEILISRYKKLGLKGFFNFLHMLIQYKVGNLTLYDSHYFIPFKNRVVEDFMVENYKYVGKGVVYTAIYGKYDTLKEPLFINDNLDYYAFTDQNIPKGSVWKKFDLSFFPELENFDAYHLSKYIKLFPYKFFSKYDFSIWVDGNVQLIADTYPLAIMAEGSAMATYENPFHDCIFTERNHVLYFNRVPKTELDRQIDDYAKAGFPKHFGMREFSIIYRNLQNDECKEIMEEWWKHINIYTMRDQFSLPFILWSKGKNIDYIKSLGENWRKNPRFMCYEHNYLQTYKK